MRRFLLTLLTLSSLAAAAQQPAKPEGAAPTEGAAAAPAQAEPAKKPSDNRSLAGMGRTPEEEERLRVLSADLQRYEEEARDFRREVQLLVERKYEEKRNGLAASYEKVIGELEIKERKERLDAIVRFEEFLHRYPREPRYSPDVMFRLAELYYERSSDEHLTAMREHEEKLKSLPESAEPPPEPQVNFGPSIALYLRLINDFRDYRFNDAAWYLLGYCYEKQNQFDESRATYEELIATYPKSRFATEAWVRIGEYWFDNYSDPTALEQAANAYEHATQDKSHSLYDKALYKLGWTYYRMDRFADAVERFLMLADFYEEQKQAQGDEGGGGDLREEALQYVAVSLADGTWGGLARAQEIFAQRGARPYEAEIYRRLGNIYFDQTNHAAAIEAYRLVLAKEPFATDAPQIQQKLVQAYERDRKMSESYAEAEKLANDYAPGSAWYEKNQSNPDALAAADALAEKSLYTSALFHHQQALTFKKEGKLEQAYLGFQVAARAYGAYLTRFPNTKSSYEMRFYYAECLFNSAQFVLAAKNYEEVRDSRLDDKYRSDAAFTAVLALQKQLEADLKAGTVKELKPLRSAERPADEVVQPIPLAESETRLISASDVYVKLLPTDEKSPGIAYKAAELYYAHNDFPEARRRFEQIVKSYPKNEVAKFATNLIVESFLIDKDWASVEDVAGRLASNKEVIDPSSDLYKSLVKFKLGGRFKLAQQLMDQGKYEEAAKKYILLVDEEPRHEFADKALNNAAVCYENSLRFDSALKLYERIYREYPSSTLADAALFRVALNSEKSYDFDKAVVSYQKLVKDYPASKDREAALYNAANLLEGQQRYPEAAAAFMRYADLFPNSEDAPKNQFRAALIYEKQEDWRGQIRALTAFIEKFSRKPTQSELVVDAKRRIGDAHKKLNNVREAEKAWASAADEFDRRKLKQETSPLAAEAASYCRFQLAELELEKFDKLKIGGTGKALERSFVAKRAGVKAVNEAYAKVYPYKNLEWTLAALYRRGYALERFATTLIETPVPPDVKRLGEEAVVAYQDQLAQQTATLEDAAVESYSATIQEARKNRLSNVWTRRTLEALNRFRPKEYPVLKEPKQAISSDAVYPEGLVGTLLGPERPGTESEAPQKLTGGGEK
ncbi:tetratricopeptide repeat protein [Hyalangium minutum]|uniref:TPR domain protein, putative component of TonB system n=1 Tax=Hyalangium minutum TaxID=394096 RepID=A0A085W2J9_9BACT|nr:tetratricopeptide repeat protein [Hyalangium minutum]KFE61912.1 TPR domain protein, putative component of TonB system [Hyalangium minutum]